MYSDEKKRKENGMKECYMAKKKMYNTQKGTSCHRHGRLYDCCSTLFLYFTKSNSLFTLVDLIFLLILSIHETSYLILPTYLHDHSHTSLIFSSNALVTIL